MTTMNYLMSILTTLLAIAFGGFFLQTGKQALLSQDAFLRFCSRLQKTDQSGIKTLDAGYFGGPANVRLIGVVLVAIGLFILISAISFLLIGLGYLT